MNGLLHLWLIPLLPFLGFLVNGLFGRHFPKRVVSAVALLFPLASFGVVLRAALLAWQGGITFPYIREFLGSGENGSWIHAGALKVDFTFALDQLNWVLGCNPYDASMLQGTGRNNPAYSFFGTFEYTNAPGGIVNGITSGLDNENDIEFNLSYAKTGKDYDWRWAEQWLPHTAWYLLAVAVHE